VGSGVGGVGGGVGSRSGVGGVGGSGVGGRSGVGGVVGTHGGEGQVERLKKGTKDGGFARVMGGFSRVVDGWVSWGFLEWWVGELGLLEGLFEWRMVYGRVCLSGGWVSWVYWRVCLSGGWVFLSG
jgi:hypothetical protein